MSQVSHKRDRSFRWQLAGISLCWIIIAVANIGVENARWYADVTAGFSLSGAVCAVILAFRPTNEVAYRWGGVLAVGALTARCATIISSEIRNDSNDYLWLAIVQIALNVLLGALYADWWLTDLKDWHAAHRAIRQ